MKDPWVHHFYLLSMSRHFSSPHYNSIRCSKGDRRWEKLVFCSATEIRGLFDIRFFIILYHNSIYISIELSLNSPLILILKWVLMRLENGLTPTHFLHVYLNIYFLFLCFDVQINHKDEEKEQNPSKWRKDNHNNHYDFAIENGFFLIWFFFGISSHKGNRNGEFFVFIKIY